MGDCTMGPRPIHADKVYGACELGFPANTWIRIYCLDGVYFLEAGQPFGRTPRRESQSTLILLVQKISGDIGFPSGYMLVAKPFSY